MNYLANAFSLSMITSLPAAVRVEEVEPADIPVSAESCVGHADTAVVLSNILGRPVALNRVSITLKEGDVLYVAQVQGRLPEGTTVLPDGVVMKFLKVSFS